jgi:signal transduction histidine kinase
MSNRAATILVVDDNPATLYSTAHVLRRAGYDVLEAATGAEATKLAEGDVDLVVLDVNLPDISGYDVCHRIRALEKLARIPVIHLSATFVKDADKVQGLERGADGYLTHPVEPIVLIATVRAFLRVREAEIERAQLLASERAARAEAERANRIKDDFLATLSHELRTPLQSILGWAQVLKMGDVTDADFAQGIEAIERNAQIQTQMITDLLDVSRITSGQLRLDVGPVDLPAVIDAVVSAAEPGADAKGIRISKIVDPVAGPVAGDPSRLQQVIWNLVSNAIKFTPKGGRIELTLARVASHIEIAVSDNGPGIEPDLLPKVFERFLQGDVSTSRYGGGLGLGLAIARQLVELHGGSIRAESELGAGAKFIVDLPVTAADPVTSSESRIDHAAADANLPNLDCSRLDNVRILLVDDDLDARQILTRILTISGAVTRECEDVKQALESIPQFNPQILVSDLGMPGQDGFDLIRQVRRMGYSFQSLPAIALTAFARPDDRRRALLAGFQVHVAKPVEPHELTATIATLVGRTGS